MIDHQLIERPILPPQRSAKQAVRAALALHLRRRRRPGVSYENTDKGLLVRVGDREHVLDIEPAGLDEAFQLLKSWGAT
jgi:hypothetical protein